MLRETLFVFAALVVVLVSATQVNQCNDIPYEDANQVKISGCDSPPCNLKRKTRVSIEQSFVAENDANELLTSVHATLLGIDLPFIGVDGTNACDNIYDVDNNKVGCPVKKGTKYIYKTDFPILEIYPKVNLIVYYALRNGNDIITCFKVPAKITA
ncbi:NPC intracellular cholesterol transporter 2 homolog a-like [Vespa mandarinia]|uniref:NPC intracellular cholesterol transporter 2 homolog a-like n=1 Tax=Vespa mandarinia TaxID=7446 RepID=UPI00161BAABA|nr:NPC intracellular cholesterol transporter 2 homolog a-like [Vespa mandarinia]XP_047355312.1 NPC intracellular cholesterol transporter 2 homolog a-like [Vespa velutina]